MARPHTPYTTIAGKSTPVGDGSDGSAPMPVTAAVTIGAVPIEVYIGGVLTPVGDGSAGSAALPITGSISATNPSVGTNGAAIPTSSTQIGVDVGGVLEPVSAANPLYVSGSFTPPALQNVNVTEIGGNAVTTTIPVSGTVAIGAGSALIGKVSIDQTTPGSTNAVDATNFPVAVDSNSGNVSASTLRMVCATNSPAIANYGQGAIGSAAPSGAVQPGLVAATALPAATTATDLVGAMADKFGRGVVLIGGPRDIKGNSNTTITSSTAETTVIAAVASTFLDVYGCIIANTSASAVEVDFRDSTGGTIRFQFEVPTGETRGFMLPSSDGYGQSAVNNNWTAQCSASVASVKISLLYLKNQ